MGPLLSASYTPPVIRVLTTRNLHTLGLEVAVVYQGAQRLWSGSMVLQREQPYPALEKQQYHY